MLNLLRTFGFYLFFTILLGLIYPMVTLFLGKYMCPHQANGSLLMFENRPIGSSLIAQEFGGDKYFHSRPSAINYNATESSGSNLALGDDILHGKILRRLEYLVNKNNISGNTKIPADMVFSSASGLDPHISVENALLQMPRVARSRKLSKKMVRNLISKCIDADFVGLWGVAGVNVLKLNLALDNFGKIL